LPEREEWIVAGEERRVQPGRGHALRHERRDGRTGRHADEEIEELIQRPVLLLDRTQDCDLEESTRETPAARTNARSMMASTPDAWFLGRPRNYWDPKREMLLRASSITDKLPTSQMEVP
jgi:hypothetical protein